MMRPARRCCACGWPRISGLISYGARMHEPHCASCLADWEKRMRAAPAGWSAVRVLTLEKFRDWQRQRKETMAA
jgi:hypothetical protein